MKNVVAILMAMALVVSVAVGSIDISMKFVLPIHEYGISFHFFLCHLVFLSSLFYNFQSIGRSPAWIDLFIDTLLFGVQL